MKIVMFYHSLVSDWNHGNAHFLRGVVTELLALGHDVQVYEPDDSWSRVNLIETSGPSAVSRFRDAYPEMESVFYHSRDFDPESVVKNADLVIVHEWNPPDLVERVGRLRKRHDFVLLFHDTHHRMVTDPEAMGRYQLEFYDGVLAFGRVLRDLYLTSGLTSRAWTWHEAADVRRFHPYPDVMKEGDLVWVGNWGDDERTAELHEFLIEPVRRLGLKAAVYGVRYPEAARLALASAGIEYRGWIPNFEVPSIFARFRVTVHVPRRPYVKALPGIPTIRPFEALACGIAMVSAPWNDVEGLFRSGVDYRVAESGDEMQAQLKKLVENDACRAKMISCGLETLLGHHTCRHRVDELLAIYDQVIGEQPLAREPLTVTPS